MGTNKVEKKKKHIHINAAHTFRAFSNSRDTAAIFPSTEAKTKKMKKLALVLETAVHFLVRAASYLRYDDQVEYPSMEYRDMEKPAREIFSFQTNSLQT